MVNQKGNGLITGILIVLVLALLLGSAYYYGVQNNQDPLPPKILSLAPPAELSQSPVPSNPSTMVSSSDLNGFPIYPNSDFIKAIELSPCSEIKEAVPPGSCDATSYTWKVKANFDQLKSFYSEDKSNSGWKCSGGAGGYTNADNATGVTSCTNGSLNYQLFIDTKNGTSEYNLSISK